AFADIAGHNARYRKDGLVVPQPPKLEDKGVWLETISDRESVEQPGPEHGKTFQPLPRLETEEQLRVELLKQRKAHAPFLRELAPPLVSMRKRIHVTLF